MAEPAPSGPSLLEQLQKGIDPKIQAERDNDLNDRLNAQYESSQKRLGRLVDVNSSLPITLSSISVLGAKNTRRSFLEGLFNPLLSLNDEAPYTLEEAIKAVSTQANKLNRFDIYHEPISLFFDRPDPTDPSTTPTDLAVFLSVKEKSRIVASSGTWAGSNDGSVYFNLLLRNMFGGAESLNTNASFGTRTRSSYSASFETPVQRNPDLKFEFGGIKSSTQKSWASHEEGLRGGFTRFKWLTPGGHRHELGYSGMWRQVTGLADTASPTIRGDAGDSFKSSISHSWTNDQRDFPLLPTSGYLMKTVAEIAGFGALKGDVAFGKFEAETQAAIPIPIPFVKGTSGVSFTAGLRGGVLYPLPLLSGGNTPVQSRINDRFTLGGPTDVRGFRFSGLGPRDGPDAVGGDVFAAGGASLLVPFPRVGPEHPLRLQAFINGGRLLALKDTRKGEKQNAMTQDEVKQSVRETIAEIGHGLPSMAAGIGIVYALPVARFELNFTLPLVIRKGEEGRKGLSLGVGLNFL